MRKYSFSNKALIVALTVVFTSPLSADDQPAAGVVRISDTTQPTPDSISSPASSGVVSGSNGVVYEGAYSTASGDEDVEVVRMPADYGWVPMNRLPIYRQPVRYYREWPDKWYGEPGSGLAPGAPRFPIVYTPTDTTQLGYTYQRAPQWAPNPSMLPPPPWPPQWHLREPRQYHNRRTINWVPSAQSTNKVAEPKAFPQKVAPPKPVPAADESAGTFTVPVDQAS